jgi:hypothetical protein
MTTINTENEMVNDAIKACLKLLARENISLPLAVKAAMNARRWRTRPQTHYDKALQQYIELSPTEKAELDEATALTFAFDIIGTINERCHTDHARNEAYCHLVEWLEKASNRMMNGITLTDACAAVPFQGVVITEENR